jgi:hypothetical protein
MTTARALTARLALCCALLLTAFAVTACADDGAPADADGLQTSGFQVPGPACEPSAPQRVNTLGGDGSNRFAEAVAPAVVLPCALRGGGA